MLRLLTERVVELRLPEERELTERDDVARGLLLRMELREGVLLETERELERLETERLELLRLLTDRLEPDDRVFFASSSRLGNSSSAAMVVTAIQYRGVFADVLIVFQGLLRRRNGLVEPAAPCLRGCRWVRKTSSATKN